MEQKNKFLYKKAGYWIRAYKGRTQFIAEAANWGIPTSLIENPLEKRDIFFEVGDTAKEAAEKLEASLGI